MFAGGISFEAFFQVMVQDEADMERLEGEEGLAEHIFAMIDQQGGGADDDGEGGGEGGGAKSAGGLFTQYNPPPPPRSLHASTPRSFPLAPSSHHRSPQSFQDKECASQTLILPTMPPLATSHPARQSAHPALLSPCPRAPPTCLHRTPPACSPPP